MEKVGLVSLNWTRHMTRATTTSGKSPAYLVFNHPLGKASIIGLIHSTRQVGHSALWGNERGCAESSPTLVPSQTLSDMARPTH